MLYSPKDFSGLFGLPGFSDPLLKDHFKLYEGYVKSVNLLNEALSVSPGGPPSAELRRRFAWEFNGMRLHEYYFGNLSRKAVLRENENPLAWKIVEDYGSYARWESQFLEMGAMRGIGWVALVYDPVADRLMNAWINEHDSGLPAGTTLLAVLDVFEHAYLRDYGVKRDEYLVAFMTALDWDAVAQRFENISV